MLIFLNCLFALTLRHAQDEVGSSEHERVRIIFILLRVPSVLAIVPAMDLYVREEISILMLPQLPTYEKENCSFAIPEAQSTF